MSRIVWACVVSLGMVGCHCGLVQSDGAYGFVCHQEELDSDETGKQVESVEAPLGPEVPGPCGPSEGA